MTAGSLDRCARCIRRSAVFYHRTDTESEYLCRVHAREVGVLPS